MRVCVWVEKGGDTWAVIGGCQAQEVWRDGRGVKCSRSTGPVDPGVWRDQDISGSQPIWPY